MKTLIFTIAIIFSFTKVNAQEAIASTTSKTENFQTSKIGFYKALIAKNNFDIKIEEPKKLVVTNTKSAYYKALLIQNGFITKKNKKKSMRLANNTATPVQTTNDKPTNTLVSL